MAHVVGPYAVYIGDATDDREVKTARGIVEWTNAVRLVVKEKGCPLDIDGVDLLVINDDGSTLIEEIRSRGIKTLVLGVVPPRGVLEIRWLLLFKLLLKHGIIIATGTHDVIANHEWVYASLSESEKQNIVDFRTDSKHYDLATGKKRFGFRLLTVGHDCSCGKKYTALAIFAAMKKQNIDSDFRPTGQTGRFIAECKFGSEARWIVSDSIRADFVAGAAEWLSPDNAIQHWDVIEGQGSLWHPAYNGGVQSLLYGSQPDAIVLCVDEKRERQCGVDFAPATVAEEILANEMFAKRVNPYTHGVVGISVRKRGLHNSKIMQQIIEATRGKDVFIFDASDLCQVADFVRKVIAPITENVYTKNVEDVFNKSADRPPMFEVGPNVG